MLVCCSRCRWKITQPSQGTRVEEILRKAQNLPFSECSFSYGLQECIEGKMTQVVAQISSIWLAQQKMPLLGNIVRISLWGRCSRDRIRPSCTAAYYRWARNYQAWTPSRWSWKRIVELSSCQMGTSVVWHCSIKPATTAIQLVVFQVEVCDQFSRAHKVLSLLWGRAWKPTAIKCYRRHQTKILCYWISSASASIHSL